MHKKTIRLGVNIDHVATLRQARGTSYPDPVEAALLAQQAGADGITLHLREDRRHIQDHDVERLKPLLQVPMNFEMASTPEMLAIALRIRPEHCCVVPERRAELTTEGGLNVLADQAWLTELCSRLQVAGSEVSFFVSDDHAQIAAAKACGANTVEIHTGQYADATDPAEQQRLLSSIQTAARYAHRLGLQVHAGHGLHCDNVQPIAAIPEIEELNIGHSLIARAVFIGLGPAVEEIKRLMLAARVD